jgi:hypothetical protein
MSSTAVTDFTQHPRKHNLKVKTGASMTTEPPLLKISLPHKPENVA